MDSSANRAIVAIIVAVLAFANLVALIGYPLLIWTAVIAAFAALAFIVALSAGDLADKPARRAAEPRARTAAEAA
jgi:hypothetical protein